jgi:SAM-dependent methyltransferase
MDWDEMARPWLEAAPDLEIAFRDVFDALFETADLNSGDSVLETGAFDAIVANFGIMFFDDNAAAFANLRAATKRDGRLVATFWATPAENPWFSMPRRIVDDIVADVPRPDPSGPGPMRFGDPAALVAVLETAGWRPRVRTLDLMLRPPGPAERVADLHMKVTVGMMLKGVEGAEHRLDDIKRAVTDACKPYQGQDGMAIPARIHLVEAIAA